ncbi:MAG: DUF5103 domain-containing protein [Bacteroidia bacterium]
MKKWILSLVLFTSIQAAAYDWDHVTFEDITYVNHIKTVQLLLPGKPFSVPIIDMNQPNFGLMLNFDDLNGGFENYTYTIIHCNADWTPTNLFQNQYLEGFFEDQITEQRQSFNTLTKYTHYMLPIPNQNMKMKLSGNYVVHVYKNFDKSEPILTRRFFVLQSTMAVIPYLRRPSRPDAIQTSHELDFDINIGRQTIFNPFEEIKVVIRQNARWDNQVAGLLPLFVRNDILTYDYADRNIIKAGNEFRKVDLRNIRFRGERVADIEIDGDKIYAWVMGDESRGHMRYLSYEDLNGKFLVQGYEGRNSNTDADYIYTTFTLYHQGPLAGGNVYILGQLVDWAVNENTRMTYNYEIGAYQITLLLKQGFYDYKYVYKRDGAQLVDYTWFEGSHEDTENDYEIFVYHRPPTSMQFDRLVGYSVINSMNRFGR